MAKKRKAAKKARHKKVVKKASKKTAKKAALIKYRAICKECDWKAKARHDSAEEAKEYGVDQHGDDYGHEIDAIGTQR